MSIDIHDDFPENEANNLARNVGAYHTISDQAHYLSFRRAPYNDSFLMKLQKVYDVLVNFSNDPEYQGFIRHALDFDLPKLPKTCTITANPAFQEDNSC